MTRYRVGIVNEFEADTPTHAIEQFIDYICGGEDQAQDFEIEACINQLSSQLSIWSDT